MNSYSPFISRHHRQSLLPHWQQAPVSAADVAVVGLGALGCTAADLLARGGVGHLTLIDRDLVELTNLQRQSLYTEADAAASLPKAEAARRRLAAVNSGITLTPHIADLSAHTIRQLIPPTVAAIVDGTDNFATRYLLNDYAVKHRIPLCYGGVISTRGMQATFLCDEDTRPCLRCIFDSPPPPGSTPTCDTVGVLAPAVSMVASAQAADVFKILIGRRELLSHTLLEFDLWENTRRRLDISQAKRPDCPSCGQHTYEFLNNTAQEPATLCGQSSIQIPSTAERIDLPTLAHRLAAHGTVTHNTYYLTLQPTTQPPGFEHPCKLTLFTDGRAIIKGTDRTELARAVYARFVGH